MGNRYKRKWEIVEEIEINLFDGNSVSIQLLERESIYDASPSQIRIFTTANTSPRRLKKFTTLSSVKDYALGWEPIIMTVIQQVSEQLRETKLDTWDVFIATLFGCFQNYWINPPDFPIVLSISELNELYTSEAIDSALSYFHDAPHDENLDKEILLDWGNQKDSSDTDEEDIEL